MPISDSVIYETRTDVEYYQVVERIYDGRFSRLLYSGESNSAQSGIPLDGKDKMLFAYCQRLVELIEKIKPENILLIGGGAYTLPTYLSNKHLSPNIDVVEPDSELEAIAKRYFNFVPSSNIRIFKDYGLHFLKSTKNNYDLIIIDAYRHYEVPDEILSKKFAKYASKSLKPHGLVAANVISDIAPRSTLNKMHQAYSRNFKHSKVFPAEANTTSYAHANLIYVAAADDIKVRLLYPPLGRAAFSD